MRNEELQEQQQDSNISIPWNYKIRLIDRNINFINQLVDASFKICLGRLVIFVLLMYYDDHLIAPSNNTGRSDSWSVIFYIITSMMDFLTLLNDIQMLKLIKRQRICLQQTKKDILNKLQSPSATEIGSYKNYLSIYDLVKVYKYTPRASNSISETIRYLHLIITFYSFGNLAIGSQSRTGLEMWKCAILWGFLLSIYFSAFELDFITLQGSSGTFVERQMPSLHENVTEQHQDGLKEKQIKEAYVKSRRPFEIMYVVSILAILVCLVLYYENNMLCFMLIICIITHIVELVHQKYLQNRLMTLNLDKINFAYLTPYRILKQLTRKHKFLHLFICSLTRYSIVLSILAYFRCLSPTLLQSFLLFVINLMLFYGQLVKFSAADQYKLYYLRPCKLSFSQQTKIECSICLMHCQNKEQLLALPCFSNHIFHFKCMKNWFQQRKQCPLCRYSLRIYDIE